MEGNISELKRAFGASKARWKSHEGFKAFVWVSVLSYNLLRLARLARSGDLTPVWVPGTEQEAMRDLTRARGDMKAQERKTLHRLNAFVLCHGRLARWQEALDGDPLPVTGVAEIYA